MKVKYLFFFLLSYFFISKNYAQTDSLLVATEAIVEPEQVFEDPYDPLAPARAAFYSAVLPGLGQAYNKSYWKIPIAYVGIGAGVVMYHRNNKQYHRYRDAYKRRLAGYNDDEFTNENGTQLISNNGLIQAQKQYQRNKEISVLVAVGVYILNIVDANVDAHLRQFNVNEDLSFKPSYEFDNITGKNSMGLTINFNF